MKFCDITISYNESSGGIRTYLDQKREYLLGQTDHEHILIIPGEEDQIEVNDRSQIYTIACPYIPGHEPYRTFWRPGPIAHVLDLCQPDVIELGSFYVSAWSSFAYRYRQSWNNHHVLVGGYFHTDVARVVVSAPLERAISETIGEWSHMLEQVGYQLTDMLSQGAEAYLHSVFDRCDLKIAASEQQVARLKEYGVHDVHIVPLGVDLELFHPGKRNDQLREQYGVKSQDILLIYGGRLNEEKDVRLLVEAYAALEDPDRYHLIIMGEGPLSQELDQVEVERCHFHRWSYETDPNRYAELIASADIYVTAGPYETFGLSVAEAQAAGLAVVGVESGALTERVNRATGRLGPAHDATTFARNIQEVAMLLHTYQENARRHAEQHYSWNKTFQTMIRLYEMNYQKEQY